MQIGSNIAAFNTWNNYTNNVSSLRNSMSKLSSGSRINSAGDDPSGLAMSERLRTQSRNTAAAESNVENKLNYLQTTDSWMQKMHDMLGRMGELAVMANDGTKSATDTKVLQNEFAQMQQEIERITGSTSSDVTGADNNAAGKFNGVELFQGGDTITQQVGADGGQIFTSTFALDLSGESTSDIGTGTDWGMMITSDDATDALYIAVVDAQDTSDALSAAVASASAAGVTTATTYTDLLADADYTAWKADNAAEATLLEAETAGDTVATTVTDAATAVTDAITAAKAVGVYADVRIDSTDAAADAVTEVNSAIDFISTNRSQVGAEMKRMEHTLDGLRSYEENITATESRIRDVDVAKETTEMSKYSILQQVGTAMLAQANQLPQGVLQLLS